MSTSAPAAAVVLAAGAGTRMRSATPKVLHRICGRTLVGHVLAAVAALEPRSTLVVVGHGREAVAASVRPSRPDASIVVQEQQKGTGHAVRIALQAVGDLSGTVVVVPGDAPLLTGEALQRLVAEHTLAGNAATLLTAHVPDATGYGRIVRNDAGQVRAIVEHADADDATRAIREIGTSVYAFDGAALRVALDQLTTDNSQGEEYLTDVVATFVAEGRPVGAVAADDWRECAGVNDRVQLTDAGRMLADRLLRHWMRSGVTVVDPPSTWIDVDVLLEPDVVLRPNTGLHGATTVAAGAVLGPNVTLTDCTVGAGATVSNATCQEAEIGPGASVGPYSYLRPGTRLGAESKVGTFVETKAAELGDGAKVPHLSYVGDATVGPRTNIGAATIFVNYDGQSKSRTVVGRDARVGSDTMLVAPVTIGDGAYTAAGSVITVDVPPGALGVGRSRQRNINGWVARQRPGSAAARAAEQAERAGDNGSVNGGDAQSANGGDAQGAGT
ncbi:MAG: bifunctional UDP-N-acetylglucosamine diphosphorylase/glucosamine-1-phosphate N-acetyltransferase GlmU [Actinomycetota bacterium]|nr:bifunctional UDP-N-acetylglucosamine diphosphorylase/glucosamine-1-phosphate N-acetyltransferase GlmU [Actinomycetota bacterium]